MDYNSDNSYLFVSGTEICKFKGNSGNVNFPSLFCLGSISNEFDSNDLKEVSFKGNVYHLSIDYNAIDKSEILNIHKYFTIKNNI